MKNYFALLMISLFIFTLAVSQSAFAGITKAPHKKIAQAGAIHGHEHPQAAEGESVSSGKRGIVVTAANDGIARKNSPHGDKSEMAESMGADFKQAEGRN